MKENICRFLCVTYNQYWDILMIYKNCSMNHNTCMQEHLVYKMHLISSLNSRQSIIWLLPPFESSEKRTPRLRYFLVLPRVFNIWLIVRIFYSRKFASLVTRTRWRKVYTADKTTRGKPSKKQRQHLTRKKKLHLGAFYRITFLQKTLLKCHA